MAILNHNKSLPLELAGLGDTENETVEYTAYTTAGGALHR
jgi:hypothetical protein